MPTQEERSATTRAKLLAAARELFASRGYAATSLDDITHRARMTKGAFYHHFDDKTALFEAVFEVLEGELVERVVAGASGHHDAWERLRAGCRTFLEAALDGDVQRIVLRDAPAVLGWDRFREIDTRYNIELITQGLRDAIAEGHLEVADPEMLAQLLLGTLCEGARLVANAPDPRGALQRVAREVDDLITARHAKRSRDETTPRRAQSARRR